jgi:arylsulfatase A-like enzyme/tetratricopeptide (TPR) repeat protein
VAHNWAVKRGFIALLLVVVVAALGWYLGFRDVRPANPTRPLNILLVTIDTLRADRVGRGLTPNIDRLAARGIAYQNVRATVPLTLPSHVSLMTGTIPPVHGVRENGVVFDRKTPTLARIFKDAGYSTAAFVGAYVLNRRFGLGEGFDTYDDAVKRDPQRAEQLEAERPAGEVADAAIAWLNGRSQDNQPFFLWTHFYDPHAPYDPPADSVRANGRTGYDGEVAYVDAQLARLLATLDARGLVNSTLVVVTSDHGESLGEHGEQTHGMLLYDGALRVPLVLAGPALDSSDPAPCHQSIAPLVLDLAGHGSKIPVGMSRSAGCAMYAETLYPRRAGWHALTALSDQRWKLIASSEHELYDTTADPGEAKNVAPDQPNIVRAMATAIARSRPASEHTSQIAPEAAERLRALGYVGGSAASRPEDPDAANPARQIAAWTTFERALGQLRSGRPAGAIEILRPLAASHPEAQVFQTTLALALRENGDAREALAIYKAAVAKWADDPALFHDLAAAAREAGALNEAMRAEQAALALDDSSAMAQNGLGLLHADAGRAAEAVAAFERAVQLDPGNSSYWANLGNARQASGNRAGAEAAYRKALEADAEFADALNGLGTLYVQDGRAPDAVALFERALARDPQLHEARLNLGIALQESGQLQRAADTYRHLLATAPPSARRERQAATELLKSLPAAR